VIKSKGDIFKNFHKMLGILIKNMGEEKKEIFGQFCIFFTERSLSIEKYIENPLFIFCKKLKIVFFGKNYQENLI
jgi:hypothetical protein